MPKRAAKPADRRRPTANVTQKFDRYQVVRMPTL